MPLLAPVNAASAIMPLSDNFKSSAGKLGKLPTFTKAKMKNILITGAAGKIGDALRKGLRGSYPLIRLADIAPLGTIEASEQHHMSDICDMASIQKAMTDIDCVVHLAGVPEEAAWETVLPLNIEGCYNVFEAARRSGACAPRPRDALGIL
jgi:uronate dehydrogenase